MAAATRDCRATVNAPAQLVNSAFESRILTFAIAGWAGALCNTCASGFFGASCTACPACGAHGTCNDGSGGDGQCACSTGWTGSSCNSCASGYYVSFKLVLVLTQTLACFAGRELFCLPELWRARYLQPRPQRRWSMHLRNWCVSALVSSDLNSRVQALLAHCVIAAFLPTTAVLACLALAPASTVGATTLSRFAPSAFALYADVLTLRATENAPARTAGKARRAMFRSARPLARMVAAASLPTRARASKAGRAARAKHVRFFPCSISRTH